MFWNKLIAALLVLLALGCTTNTDSLYVEGTQTTVGIFIPYEGTIYGLQICKYLNGTAVSLRSNSVPFKITREHYATNNYFGLVKTQEKTRTEIEVKDGNFDANSPETGQKTPQ